MSKDILSAPVRMVALHSGKYDFAEVRLDAPLHLMGANNVGKTSLISMLQFLYLSEQRKMHFSHPLNETRKYYFPDTYSYILFECRTPEGMAVVGVHGLGAARQYEFERFSYRGRLELDDYLTEERNIRDPEPIKARLAGKEYVKLEPQHLRAALSGVGENRGVQLGLVPLKDRSQYERFSFLFCNLLRLAQLRQNELKELLVEIYKNEFQQKEINLVSDYRERFNRLQRDVLALKELRWIEEDIKQLFEIVQLRDRARKSLPFLWAELGRKFTACNSELESIESQKKEAFDALKLNEKSLKEERSEVTSKRDALIEELGKYRNKLQDYQELENSLSDFIYDWEKQRYDDLRKVTTKLEESISRLEGEKAERIHARIMKLEREKKNAIQLRDSAEQLLLARIRGELEDHQIAELFRIINPALLQIDKSAVELIHSPALRQRLDRLLAKISMNTYDDGDIKINLKDIEPVDIKTLVDPERLAFEITELDRQIKQETSLLEIAQNREKAEKELKAKRQEEEELSRRLHQWNELCEKRDQAESWKTRLRTLEMESEKLQAQIDQINQKIQGLEKEGQALLAHAAAAAKERADLLEKQRRILPPGKDWESDSAVDLPESLDDLYELYRRTFGEEKRFAEEAEGFINRIEERTYGKYNGQTERETFHRLQEAIDALESRELALKKSWADFAVGLRSSFSALSHDLDRLEGKVNELNRKMGKVAISNLDAVGLIVKEHPEWMKRIKSLCALHDDLPLFTETNNSSRDMEELGHMLEQTQTVRLYDLFDLHFKIQGSDGKERVYPDLDKIESNGTTITIKVLVHLILLRDLMSGNRASVPFYLDEVSSLDHDNIFGIIAQAKSLGFIPVLASPEPVEEVDRIYLLAENTDGSIVLDETALIEIRKEHVPR